MRPFERDEILLFLKLYDPVKESLSFLGSCFAKLHWKLQDLLPLLNSKAAFPEGTPLEVHCLASHSHLPCCQNFLVCPRGDKHVVAHSAVLSWLPCGHTSNRLHCKLLLLQRLVAGQAVCPVCTSIRTYAIHTIGYIVSLHGTSSAACSSCAHVSVNKHSGRIAIAQDHRVCAVGLCSCYV